MNIPHMMLTLPLARGCQDTNVFSNHVYQTIRLFLIQTLIFKQSDKLHFMATEGLHIVGGIKAQRGISIQQAQSLL